MESKLKVTKADVLNFSNLVLDNCISDPSGLVGTEIHSF